MRDYAEQVKRLRNQAKLERYYHGSGRICDEAADAIEELVEQRDGLLASALELMYREDLLRWFGCHNCDTQKEAEK